MSNLQETRFTPVFLIVKLSLIFAGTINSPGLVSAGWIDPDTPKRNRVATPLSKGDHRLYELVFSDEFEVDGRTFADGEDPRWTALNKNDFANNPLHYYSHEAVHSRNGSLVIDLEVDPRDDLNSLDGTSREYKDFKSGMVQSWNKFCFTGGIIEFAATIPGTYRLAGLWPALWMMGNLGRATYVDSTENVWPFSTNVCDERTRNSQKVNSCRHSTHVEGMFARQGRGAPEIDLLEVLFMDDYFDEPVLSTSLQVAPGVFSKKRPEAGYEPNQTTTWYSPNYGENITRNSYFYGTVSYPGEDSTTTPYRTDSISAMMKLNKAFYETSHTFRVEWEPPDQSGDNGYMKWFIDDKFITSVDGHDVYKTSKAEIPSEPMYILMNLAVSRDWGFPDAWSKNCPKKCWTCLDPECECALPKGFCNNLPASFLIDSVRVYQPLTNDKRYSLGCSPPHRPTKKYIEENKELYKLLHEEEPLLEVQVGGGPCQTDDDCGGVIRGVCAVNASCICATNWTGPKCRAHRGYLEWGVRPDSELRRSTLELTIASCLAICIFLLLQFKHLAFNESEKQAYMILNTISTPEALVARVDAKSPYNSYQRGNDKPSKLLE